MIGAQLNPTTVVCTAPSLCFFFVHDVNSSCVVRVASLCNFIAAVSIRPRKEIVDRLRFLLRLYGV